MFFYVMCFQEYNRSQLTTLDLTAIVLHTASFALFEKNVANCN